MPREGALPLRSLACPLPHLNDPNHPDLLREGTPISHQSGAPSHFPVQLFATLWTAAHQAPLSMGFSRQEYWSGWPRPPPGDPPDPGIEPTSPTLWADFLPSEPPGKPNYQGSPGGGLLVFKQPQSSLSSSLTYTPFHDLPGKNPNPYTPLIEVPINQPCFLTDSFQIFANSSWQGRHSSVNPKVLQFLFPSCPSNCLLAPTVSLPTSSHRPQAGFHPGTQHQLLTMPLPSLGAPGPGESTIRVPAPSTGLRPALPRHSNSQVAIYMKIQHDRGFPGGSDGKESAYNAGNSGSIPRSGRFPREGNGNPVQYSCPENSMDRGAGGLQSMGLQNPDMTERLTHILT